VERVRHACSGGELRLKGWSEDDFHRFGDQVAKDFGSLPGLLGKIWLRNQETGTYGAVYLWRDRRSMEEYATSDLFNAVKTHPNLTNVTSKDYEVFEDLTEKTQPGLELITRVGAGTR
jgi:hypothetical protein